MHCPSGGQHMELCLEPSAVVSPTVPLVNKVDLIDLISSHNLVCYGQVSRKCIWDETPTCMLSRGFVILS